MSTSLANNMYVDFMNQHKNRLKQFQNEVDIMSVDELVLLVDFDNYIQYNDVDNALFVCAKQKLPDYAISKIEGSKQKKMIALKHVGLCLVTEL